MEAQRVKLVRFIASPGKALKCHSYQEFDPMRDSYILREVYGCPELVLDVNRCLEPVEEVSMEEYLEHQKNKLIKDFNNN